MRKTKIICTLGPSTDQEGVLRELVANGMNVARFNFSHGSHEEHLGRFEKLKAYQLFIAGLLYVHFHAVRADLHRLAERRKGIFRRKIGRAAVCNDLRCHKFQFFLTNLFFRKFQARSVPFEAMTFLYQ